MAHIELEDQTAAILQEQARSRQMTLDTYLRMLAERAASTPSPDFDRWLDALSEGTDILPPLPPSQGRADYYHDHD